MPLSWNEIRRRAITFGTDWSEVSRERAEAQTFWNEFFEVFGVRRRTVASFEEPVRSIRGTYGFIDLFWKGRLLAEHKSAGSDLSKATSQAMNYIQDLQNEVQRGRRAGEEIPRYILVSDFSRLAIHDLEEGTSDEILIAKLHEHIRQFAFIPGYRQQRFEAQDPINIRAVELLGALHDTLEDGGYTGHNLERFLVRVLFCLFADDTGIFEPDLFAQIIERCGQDGKDVGPLLQRIFETLDTPKDKRQVRLDESLAELPYVNGGLFAERLPIADFDAPMLDALLRCARLDWSRISPAIFGSLFQSVMDREERRRTGGHYTSERDILKVVNSLFLDDLREEFRRAGKSYTKLSAFHDRLANLRFLDPACGCGNFLVVAYRELRLLELDVLKLLVKFEGDQTIGIDKLARIDVDAFFGIEISEFPARIAEAAMWLMDHQMNLRLSEEFGQYYVRLPLRKSPTIIVGNALRLNWAEILPPDQCSWVLGNPPFVGAKLQSDDQRGDMQLATGAAPGAGLLDYVCGWYFKAADYIQGTSIRVGFVSTNSIAQGEQVGLLWSALYSRYTLDIHFAHRTFCWQSEARGRAHVHVVIIGFAAYKAKSGQIFDYETDPEHPTVIEARNISPYLVDASDVVIVNRSQPLSPVPSIGIGNKPIDGGNYLFTPEEKERFLMLEPAAAPFFRRWLGAQEFLHNIERWCLWLGDCPPEKLREMPHAMKRVSAVRDLRMKSKSTPTRALANIPTRFHVENMPEDEYLLIPSVSSERRSYIPIAFIQPDILASNLVLVVPAANLYHFGVLSSSMHMAWMRQVCGRLESRYRYSAKLVYNNFPWPETVSSTQRHAVEAAATNVLETRAAFPASSMADLYDVLAMPPQLVRAHEQLDRAVDRCYRSQPFTSDRARVEFLFSLYESLTTPLISSRKRS